MDSSTTKGIMNKEKEAQSTTPPDFFTELYDTINHAMQQPRVIGGGKITREQAAALGIPTDGTIHQK
jgi:hypothetical protein